MVKVDIYNELNIAWLVEKYMYTNLEKCWAFWGGNMKPVPALTYC